MLTSDMIDELDVVRLKDGREGTIVYICSATKDMGPTYEVEISGTKMEIETTPLDQIEEVIWKIKDH